MESSPASTPDGAAASPIAPVAFVKLKAGHSVTDDTLKKFLAERLNKIEMPKEIIFKDALPKTLIGKLSKKELREEYAQTRARK